MVIYHGIESVKNHRRNKSKDMGISKQWSPRIHQSYRNSEPFLEMWAPCIPLQVGPVTSLKWSYGGPVISRVFDPSYPFIRPFIEVITPGPFITSRGPLCTSTNPDHDTFHHPVKNQNCRHLGCTVVGNAKAVLSLVGTCSCILIHKNSTRWFSRRDLTSSPIWRSPTANSL